MNEGIGVATGVPDWVNPYIEQYKKAKITNRYTTEIEQLINKLMAQSLHLMCGTILSVLLIPYYKTVETLKFFIGLMDWESTGFL